VAEPGRSNWVYWLSVKGFGTKFAAGDSRAAGVVRLTFSAQ